MFKQEDYKHTDSVPCFSIVYCISQTKEKNEACRNQLSPRIILVDMANIGSTLCNI